MKTLAEYMDLPYKMEVLKDTEGKGYVVSFPDLKGCISCGTTIEAALKNAEDAKKEWIAAAMEEGITIPEAAQN